MKLLFLRIAHYLIVKMAHFLRDPLAVVRYTYQLTPDAPVDKWGLTVKHLDSGGYALTSQDNLWDDYPQIRPYVKFFEITVLSW